MTFVRRFAAVLIVTFALCGSSIAQSRRTQNDSLPSSATRHEAQIRDRLNAWTVGLAGGLLEGAPIHLATEMARVVSDGGVMQVLPIVTRGPTENVNDLLYLKGIDAAIINSDSLEEYKSQVPQIQQRITYILRPVSLRIAHLRSAGNSIALGSGGQESQLQYARDRRRLFRSSDFQPPRSRCREDVYPAPRGAGANEARRDCRPSSL